MKKKIMGGKTRKIELDSDLAINDDQVSLEIEEKKPKRERKQKEPKKKQRAPKDTLGNSVNYVKTSNKLIGEIENNDLYASDDLNDGFGATTHDRANMFGGDEDLRGADIDFGNDQPKDSNMHFLKKMKSKREEQDRNQGIEQDVINLGFVQTFSQSVGG
jgi:hypothetical protein